MHRKKTLKLSKETVQNLTGDQLRGARGGRVVPGEQTAWCDISEVDCDPGIETNHSCVATCFQYYTCVGC